VRADDAIRLHLVPAFGARPLGSLTPLDVQKLVNELAQRFAPATTRTYYAVLRAILNGALNADLIARSPCRGIKLPRVTPKARVIVGPEEIHRLADAIAPEYRVMVLCAAELGFRWGECAGLQVRDVDALRRTVTVRLNVGEVRGALDIGEPKTNAGRRTVAASAQLMAAIAEHLHRRGLTARNAEAWVFAAREGGPLLYSNFRQRVWLPAVRKAELEELTFHGLRHAAATSWVAAGIDRRTAQHRLGHATPRLVLELYEHATTEADRAAADLMGARLFGDVDVLDARRAP
jgi:integrase